MLVFIFLLMTLLLVVGLLAYPLGFYIVKLASYQPIKGLNWIARLERFFYRWAQVSPEEGMTWQKYTLCLLIFNTLGGLVVFATLCLQYWLPLNPHGMSNLRPDTALNTAISFITNTDWQSYSGEISLSYFSQAVALTGQNFFSAATGIAVLFAFIRGFIVNEKNTIGNFWVDLTRITLYLLLPLSFLFAIGLMSQGVIQNFSSYQKISVLDKTVFPNEQTLPMGPIASQEAIKLLGTNGGGFLNANSAHPFENPTPLSKFFADDCYAVNPDELMFCFWFHGE